MRLVLTGGHVTPAYSFAEVAAAHQNDMLMIGSAGKESVEAKEMAALGCGYRTIVPVKFNRFGKLTSILKTPLLIVPILQSVTCLRQFGADAVVAFGGFNAVPVCLAAGILRIPFVLHEQTRTAGLANRLLAGLSKRCAVSYAESGNYFPGKKTVVTGNLLRMAIWHCPDSPPMTLPTDKPVLYITGGNQGSRTINDCVGALLPQLSERYQVVWQYGRNTSFDKVAVWSGILAKQWFSANEVSWLLHHAHLIISRGGANTTAELMVGGAPSIIIPISVTAANEQYRNAKVIADSHAGIIIEQKFLTPSSLHDAIGRLESDYRIFQENAARLKQTQDPLAADKLYRVVCEVAGDVC